MAAPRYMQIEKVMDRTQDKENKEEIMKFVKSYIFSSDTPPKIHMIQRYTTLGYHKLIKILLEQLVAEKKIHISPTEEITLC